MKKQKKQIWISAAACSATVAIVGIVAGSAIWSVSSLIDTQVREQESAAVTGRAHETAESFENIVSVTKAASGESWYGEKSVYGIQNVKAAVLPEESFEAVIPEPDAASAAVPSGEENAVAQMTQQTGTGLVRTEVSADPVLQVAGGSGSAVLSEPETSAEESAAPVIPEQTDPPVREPEPETSMLQETETLPVSQDTELQETSASDSEVQEEPVLTDQETAVQTEEIAETPESPELQETAEPALPETIQEFSSQTDGSEAIPETAEPSETAPASVSEPEQEPSTEGTTAHGDHHVYEEIILEQPTCIAPGKARYVCRICEGYYDALIPETGIHNWVIVPDTENLWRCSVCGAEYSE